MHHGAKTALRALPVVMVVLGSSQVWNATANAPEQAPLLAGSAPSPLPAPPAATPTTPRYRCTLPETQTEATGPCADGANYPACTWRITEPEHADYDYRIWRNTREEHRRGRPALVSLILATAQEYRRRFPGEQLVIGDLDAPGPRHMTHRNGQDVDLYLPGAMIADNHGGGEYPSNYLHSAPLGQQMRRDRVMELAKILATCAGGDIRIYYNDPSVNERFKRWFRDQDLRSSFGEPMRYHNDLHRFHFHLTVAEDLSVLPEQSPDNG